MMNKKTLKFYVGCCYFGFMIGILYFVFFTLLYAPSPRSIHMIYVAVDLHTSIIICYNVYCKGPNFHLFHTTSMLVYAVYVKR